MKLSRKKIDSVILAAKFCEELLGRNGATGGDQPFIGKAYKHLREIVSKLSDEERLEFEALYWFGKEDRFGARDLRFFDQAVDFAQFERKRWARPKSQTSFLFLDQHLSSALQRGVERYDREQLETKLSETRYPDSKIRQAFYELVVGSGNLLQRIQNAGSGIAVLRSDKTGRFTQESEDVNHSLRTVKQGDYSRVTEGELRVIAEAVFSAHTKLQRAEL